MVLVPADPRPILVWLSLALMTGVAGCSTASSDSSLPGMQLGTGGGSASGVGSGGSLASSGSGGTSASPASGGSTGWVSATGGAVNYPGGSGGATGSGGSQMGTGGSSSTGSGGSPAGGGPSPAPGGSSGAAGAFGAGGARVGGAGGARAGGNGGSAGALAYATGGASGAPGAGGRGTGPGGDAGGSGTNGQCPANAIFCADFESGTIPAQAAFFPEYLRAQISSYVTVEANGGLNGGSAARFAGTSFSQMLGVVTGTSTFWTRVYLRMDLDVSMVTGHGTYVLATDGNGDPNMGEQIRVGEHTCQLELNRRSDDKELLSNGGSFSCSGGIAFGKNNWYCLETFYDGPGRQVRVFVGGTESDALRVTDWGPYNYGVFKFGFEKYSSPMRTIWYDDVAVAPQRIGCH